MIELLERLVAAVERGVTAWEEYVDVQRNSAVKLNQTTDGMLATFGKMVDPFGLGDEPEQT